MMPGSAPPVAATTAPAAPAPVVPAPAVPAPSVDPTGSRVFGLLSLVDPRVDSVRGAWSMAGESLVNPSLPEVLQIVRIPYVPGEADEFDLRVGFVFREEGAGFRALLSHGGRHFDFYVDQKGLFGLGDVLKPGDAQRSRAGASWPAPSKPACATNA